MSDLDTITDQLCAELRARSDRGVQKYGVTLDAANLTPAQILQHAKEEALDLAAHLQKLIDSGDAADRIKNAPRAWAVKYRDLPIDPGNGVQKTRKKALAECIGEQRPVQVALVEVEETQP